MLTKFSFLNFNVEELKSQNLYTLLKNGYPLNCQTSYIIIKSLKFVEYIKTNP